MIEVRRVGAHPERIRVAAPAGRYVLEVDAVCEHLHRLEAPWPLMSWDDSLGNMRALDRWRAAVGLVYDCEQPEEQVEPLRGGQLRVRPHAEMQYGEIDGIDKPVSKLFFGTYAHPYERMREAAVLFDHYFEHGGNSFDTAWVYWNGGAERAIGQWMRTRGVRDQVVILAKGAHTPECTPEAVPRQLAESLDRLGTDHADLYMLHRDNLEVPVEEFVDVLNHLRSAGLINGFGGSNWTLERVSAFNRAAERRGVVGMVALSNNLSLATMVNSPWEGSLSAGDVASRDWLTQQQFPLLAWSSQAQGFFSGADILLSVANSWSSSANLARRERAQELGARHGVTATTIALAWVLRQPFPTFALIGPREIAETRSSLDALALDLAPAELDWLEWG